MIPPWAFRAVQLFAAAAAALGLAVALGLQNPFWAAMPIWVVAQPHRQDLLLRAALRVAGTVMGALIGWAALTMLDGPAARIAVLAAAVGVSAAGAYRIGTVYSYGLQLVGITVAVVLVPAMDHRVDATALALDRIGCTLIGVIAVTAVTFLFTPRRDGPAPAPPPGGTGAVLRHGIIAAGAAAAGAALVLTVGGPAGIAAGMTLCIFSIIIGAARNPAPMLTFMLPGAALGVGAALLYRLLDHALAEPGQIALLLALPFLAVGAVLRSHPRSAPLGIDANMCFLLAAEAGTAGHPLTHHLLGGIAQVAAAALFIAAFRRFGATP